MERSVGPIGPRYIGVYAKRALEIPIPGETRALLFRQKLLTEHLVGKLLEAGEISLNQALSEIRSFEGGER